MRHRTREFVDAQWADLFGIDAPSMWTEASARPHGRLGDYPGFLVAWRGQGVHVSLPAGCPSEIAESLATQGIPVLQTVEYWTAFARSRGLTVVGPSTHHYLDEDPGMPSAVVRVRASELDALRGSATADEWEEGGFGDEADVIFGVRADGDVIAAANLTSYAVTHHEVARWRGRTTNRGSIGAARRLGFEPWCTQLAIR